MKNQMPPGKVDDEIFRRLIGTEGTIGPKFTDKTPQTRNNSKPESTLQFEKSGTLLIAKFHSGKDNKDYIYYPDTNWSDGPKFSKVGPSTCVIPITGVFREKDARDERGLRMELIDWLHGKNMCDTYKSGENYIEWKPYLSLNQHPDRQAIWFRLPAEEKED
jgi:hypothetical protein